MFDGESTINVDSDGPLVVIDLSDLLGLSRHESGELGTLEFGPALWKVGRTGHLVAHILGERERSILDTDGRMVRVSHELTTTEARRGGSPRVDAA